MNGDKVGDTHKEDWSLSGIGPDGEFSPDVERIHDRYRDIITAALERDFEFRDTGHEFRDTGHEVMHYKCGHIVWDDGNMGDEDILSSIKWAREGYPLPAPPVAIRLAIRALRELLRVPKERRLFWSRSVQTCTKAWEGGSVWDGYMEVVPYAGEEPPP